LPTTPVIIIVCVFVIIVTVNILLAHPPDQIVSAKLEISHTGNVQADQKTESKRSYFTLSQKQVLFPQAPEIRGIAGYINTEEPISLAKLRDEGKVVLLDFWTYSCINCRRTIPYLNSWHEKYADSGIVILGVHSPEFTFEKDYANVKSAVESMEIKYPVLQDNDFQTWRAYGNRYWPRKYLIDIDGFISFDHIGEGAYEETEKMIQDLLQERADRFGIEIKASGNLSSPKKVQDVQFGLINTPEIYLGYALARAPLGNTEGFVEDETHEYSLSKRGFWRDNLVYLGGKWYSAPDRIHAEGKSVLGLKYSASSVNIVAGGNGIIEVLLDGYPISDSVSGKDVSGGKVRIDNSTLYNLVQNSSYGTHYI
jgi:thiol-disulfide isomerase/thioredoxin